MQVKANGHMRRSAAEWHGIIERYRQSGLGMNEFCTQEGLRPGTFEQWYRRTRSAAPRRGQFVEVPSLVALGGPWAVDVELPNGVRLRARRGHLPDRQGCAVARPYGLTRTRRPVKVSVIGCPVSLAGLRGSSPASKKRSVIVPATLSHPLPTVCMVMSLRPTLLSEPVASNEKSSNTALMP